MQDAIVNWLGYYAILVSAFLILKQIFEIVGVSLLFCLAVGLEFFDLMAVGVGGVVGV